MGIIIKRINKSHTAMSLKLTDVSDQLRQAKPCFVTLTDPSYSYPILENIESSPRTAIASNKMSKGTHRPNCAPASLTQRNKVKVYTD